MQNLINQLASQIGSKTEYITHVKIESKTNIVWFNCGSTLYHATLTKSGKAKKNSARRATY